MSLYVSCTARFVGPRDSLVDREYVWLAVQVAAGFDAEPTTIDEKKEAARVSLPWTLLPDGTSFKAFLIVPGAPGSPPSESEIAIVTHSPDTLGPQFEAELRDHIASRAENVAGSDLPLTFLWSGQRESDDATAEDPILWPALMQTLAALPPPLNGVCHATWYVRCETAQLLATDGQLKDAALVIVPYTMTDAHAKTTLKLQPRTEPISTDWKIGDATDFDYQSADATASARTATPGLSLKSLTETKDGFGLQRYWLDVTDVRGRSLAHIEQSVLKVVDAQSRLAVIEAGGLEPILVVNEVADDGTTRVPVPLTPERRRALASSFHEFALKRARAEGPPPATAPELTQKNWEMGRRDAAALILAVLAQGDLKDDPVDKIRKALTEYAANWWDRTARNASEEFLKSGLLNTHEHSHEVLELASGQAEPLLDALLDHVLPLEPPLTPRPVLPGEGIDFRAVSPEQAPLTHEDHTAADSQGKLAEVAAVGVLVRRAKRCDDLKDAPWRLITSGVPVIDPNGDVLTHRAWGSKKDPGTGKVEPDLPHAPAIVARGLGAAFVDGVLRNDYEYAGTPLGTGSALAFVHRRTDVEGEGSNDYEKQRLAFLSFESPAPIRAEFTDAEKTSVQHVAAPPLRYGDWYEIAAFIIDRVGGMPKELWRDELPWRPELRTLDHTLKPGGTPRKIEFKRRVPVGEVNVTPGLSGLQKKAKDGDPDKKADWPTLPADVSLRAREWQRAQDPENDSAPVILLGKDMRGIGRGADFTIEPPRLDEHTLQRWLIPAQDSTTLKTELDALRTELKRIFRARDAQVAAAAAHATDAAEGNDKSAATAQAIRNAQTLLPHDPAVSAIVVAITRVDDVGRLTVERRQILWLEKLSDEFPFIRKPLVVHCFVAEDAETPGAALNVPVAEGHFACVEFFPAVDAATFEARMDGEVLKDLFTPAEKVGEAQLVLFHPTRVLIEHATARLPTSEALYEALSLRVNDTGAVVVSVQPTAKMANWAFTDRFDLNRQRWIWRNLPLSDPEDHGKHLGSQLPEELATPTLRDSHVNVHRFDVLAAIDRGLVDRGKVSGTIPRGPDGGMLPAPDLLTDDRDGVTSADYLRFGLIVRSRYAGVLGGPNQPADCEAHAPGSEYEPDKIARWRRIVTDFRGSARDIKPVKILTVLPLTKSPERSPRDDTEFVPDSARPTPFIIVLDECWFREYGQGEVLQTRIVLETREIGEGVDNPRPFRAGPIPDHHIDPASPDLEYYRGAQYSDADAEKPANMVTLDTFGPFGFSLDRSGNEALANATAFVLLPPADIGPRWSLYVQCRRVLRGLRPKTNDTESPYDEVAGPWSDAHPLYTLPDSAALCRPAGPAANGEPTLVLVPRQNEFDLQYQNLVFDLIPYGPSPPDAVRSQYRYLLVVGPVVSDGGRGANIMLPEQGYWLTSDRLAKKMSATAASPDAPRLGGRVFELITNGRYDGKAPLDGAPDLRKLFQEYLLRQPSEPLLDAPGAVTRISRQFTVSFA